VRLAVVGCGAVAAIHHLPAIGLGGRAVASVLVDADRARARALADRHGVAEVRTDYREVEGLCDAAIVALPNALHAPVAIDLLSRGIHVLVEKPMAVTAAECDRMIAAAGRSGAVLAVGLEFRFFDAARLVRELLAAGVLGDLRGFDLRQGVVPRWPFASDFILRKEAAGGGVLADFGTHVLDLLLWWLGDWAEVDYRDDARGGLESDCELDLALRSGLAGTVEVSRTRTLRNTCRIEGERGILEVGVWDPDPTVSLRLGAADTALAGRARRPGAENSPGVDFREAFRRQLDDFAAAVQEGRAPFVPGEEGRRSIALIEACYTRRRPLELPWDRPHPLAGWEVAGSPGAAAGDAGTSKAP
jgi:predicted dehydrogenase